MKKQLFIVSALFMVVSICSCKKDTTGIPPSAGVPKIKTRTNGNTVRNYEYNPDGTISKQAISGNAFPEYTYVYNGNTISMKRYLADGTISEDVTMTLNSKGLVDDYSNAKYPSQLIKYEFNDAGLLVKKTIYQNGSLDQYAVFRYENGNLVCDSTFSNNGTLNYIRNYEHFTGMPSTIENDNFGQGFWGKGNVNALKKVTYKDHNGVVTGTQEYLLPILDNLSRIQKTTYQSSNSPTPVTLTYSYY